MTRPAALASVAPDPRVSAVIITRDRREELSRTLERLRTLPERPEIYVVDNGSSDGTAELLRNSADVHFLAPGQNLGAAGRNLGVLAARTQYVAFCDDDTWWSPGSLRRAADVLDAHPRLAVVTARIVVEPGGEDDPICEDLRTSPLPSTPDAPGPLLVSFLAGASMVRTSAFVACGGFDRRVLIGGEEELLAADLLREGWGIAHVPDLEVHHQASGSRDAHERRRQGIRNALWFTWLRRPLPSAVRRTWRLLSILPHDRVSAAGVLDALRGIPWVLRARRPVPDRVEQMYAAVDALQFRSGARRYVS